MLLELAVENFGLIEKLKISFKDGLHVITGETGAGKSMLIDALTVVIGGRASQDLIRHGCDFTYVEALFEVPRNLFPIFEEQGIEFAEDGQLIIQREIKLQGRSTCRVNGRLLPVQILKEIMEPLVDIHGQHEHQKLLNTKEHLFMLDGFGKNDIDKLLADVAKTYSKYQEIYQKHRNLLSTNQDDIQRIEFLEYQLNELKLTNLQNGEEEELETKKQRFVNIDKISKNITHINTSLMDGNNDNEGAYNLINNSIQSLQELSKIDISYEKYIDMLENANILITEVTREISTTNDIDFEEDINHIEARLFQLQQLKRKYRLDIEELIEYQEQITQELYELQNKYDVLDEIKQKLDTIKSEYNQKAEQLSVTRKQVAQKMEQQIQSELSQLSLPNVQFKIQFEQYDQPRVNGTDDVEFLFSANIGEPLKSIAKIASGGELSRIMLALKNILAEVDQTPTVIFDEVDTGVSGIAAQKVAEKLASISNNRQVFCITHLPQIAAMSDVHLYISKQSTDQKTVTNVDILNDEEVINELSRMISGQIITDKTKDNAKEIRDNALKYKKYLNK